MYVWLVVGVFQFSTGKTRYAASTAGTLVYYGQEQYKCTGILFKICRKLQCNTTAVGTLMLQHIVTFCVTNVHITDKNISIYGNIKPISHIDYQSNKIMLYILLNINVLVIHLFSPLFSVFQAAFTETILFHALQY